MRKTKKTTRKETFLISRGRYLIKLKGKVDYITVQ